MPQECARRQELRRRERKGEGGGTREGGDRGAGFLHEGDPELRAGEIKM